tara:strand:- start:14856 stop:15686 length:831 start_codon:yes stop_codon:yes gene_type:complete
MALISGDFAALQSTTAWAVWSKGRKWDFTVESNTVDLGEGLIIDHAQWSPYLELEREHFIASLNKKPRTADWLKKNSNQRRGQTFRPQAPKNEDNKKLLNRRAYLKRANKEDDTWLSFPEYHFEDPELVADFSAMLFPAALLPERACSQNWAKERYPISSKDMVDKGNVRHGSAYNKVRFNPDYEVLERKKTITVRDSEGSKEIKKTFYMVKHPCKSMGCGKSANKKHRRHNAFLSGTGYAEATKGITFRAWKRMFNKQKKLVITAGVPSGWGGCW